MTAEQTAVLLGRSVDAFTPNQIVAYNLRRARLMRGWSQGEATERLEPYLGTRWSNANYSAAERSVVGGRVRQFTADELFAFARGFRVALTYFFIPPAGPLVTHISGQYESDDNFLELVFHADSAVRSRLEERGSAHLLAEPDTDKVLREAAERARSIRADMEELQRVQAEYRQQVVRESEKS